MQNKTAKWLNPDKYRVLRRKKSFVASSGERMTVTDYIPQWKSLFGWRSYWQYWGFDKYEHGRHPSIFGGNWEHSFFSKKEAVRDICKIEGIPHEDDDIVTYKALPIRRSKPQDKIEEDK